MTVWIPGLVALFVFTLVLALFQPKKSLLKEKMEILRSRSGAFEDGSQSADFWQRVILPLAGGIAKNLLRRVGRFSPLDLQRRLTLAGNPMSLAPEQYMSIKLFLSASLAIATTVLTGGTWGLNANTLIWVLFALLAGWFFPDLWLDNLKKTRQHAIMVELPPILDILVVTTEAGLSFDAALKRIADTTDGVLASEIRTVIEELQLNRRRVDALKDMAERCDVEDLSVFITSIIQAEQLGASVTQILRSQASRVREKVRQRIEEKGGKMAVSLLMPTVIFIVPALFIVVLGGAALSLMEGLLL